MRREGKNAHPLGVTTLRGAAERLGVHPDTLRAQIHRGKLDGVRLGRDWLIRIEEVLRYEQTSSRKGRRRG